MASGTIYGTTGNQYIDAKIEWSSSFNATKGVTEVVATLYYKRNNSGFETKGTGDFSVTIDGETYSETGYVYITEHAWYLAITAVREYGVDVGKKSITISATGAVPDTSLTSTSCSGIASIDAPPVASSITSAGNITLGNACNVKWTPLNKSFRYKVKFSMGSWSHTTGAIHPNTTSSYTYKSYTIPLAAANQIPNSPTGTMTATLYTYSDSGATTQVGDASSKTFTVTVPDNVNTKPYATEMKLSSVSSLGEAFKDLYVQGLSKVKVTSTEVGQYGAAVVWKNITVENKEYGSGSDYTSDYLSGYDSISVKLTIQDSRGFTNTKTLSITVIPYSKPRVIPRAEETSVVCARCDENGNLTDSGTYLRIRARRSYSPCLVDGVQKNFCGLRFRYKKYFGTAFSDWQNLLLATDNTTEEVDAVVLNGALETNVSYVVQIDAVDSIQNHAYVSFDVPTDEVYLHKAGSLGSLGIGEYVEGSNVISIAKSKPVRLKSNINGVRMYNRAVSGTTDLDIDTKYADFSGAGNERQTFFVFGEANGIIVYGVARVSDNGATLWAGTDGVTLTTKTGGVLTVVLPKKAFDVFTIISGRDFTA